MSNHDHAQIPKPLPNLRQLSELLSLAQYTLTHLQENAKVSDLSRQHLQNIHAATGVDAATLELMVSNLRNVIELSPALSAGMRMNFPPCEPTPACREIFPDVLERFFELWCP